MTLVLQMTGFHRLPCRDTPGPPSSVLRSGSRLLRGWGGQTASSDSVSKSSSLHSPRDFSAGGRHGPTTPAAASHKKRKLDHEEDGDQVLENRPKRISAMWNTPKQRRDDRRKVLRISVQKLRQIDDPELFLRRSVLINNTMKRMQQEIRDEKCHGYGHFYRAELATGRSCTSPVFEPRETLPRRKPSPYHHHPHRQSEGVTTSYLSANAHLFDDVYTHTGDCDRITDDMTDRLVRSLEQTAADCTSGDTRVTCTNTTHHSHMEDIANNNNTVNTPKPTNLSYIGKLNNNGIKTAPCSVNEKQLLGDIDVVFNNLISALSADTKQY